MTGYEVPMWAGATLDAILAAIPPGRQLRIETVQIWSPPDRTALNLFHIDPGAPRRVPVKLCPTLVGDPGQTVADLLEIVAHALRLAPRHNEPLSSED